MKKIKVINCVVINHIHRSVEAVPFTDTKEASEFCEFVMEMEKTILEVFFGKECEVQFDHEKQSMTLFNKTDDIEIVEINVGVHEIEIPE